ncbi:unnamed protein product [Aphanomyces euteiches]
MGPKKPAAAAAPSKPKDIPDDGPPVIVSEERPRIPRDKPPEDVPPLFQSSVLPKECFPEWTDNLDQENWYSASHPFEDPMGLPSLPAHINVWIGNNTANITWKRPSQFLPPLPEPVKPASTSGPVKTPADKSKKPVAPPPKKTDTDLKTEEPKAPRHCYVLYDASVDPLVEKFDSSHPGFAPPQHAERHEWTHDFQRVWSDEQAHDIKRWEAEESRIQMEKEHRENALMAYEESCILKLQKALAALKQATEAELNDEDLVDDGDDTLDFPTAASTGATPTVLFSDVFGLPPVIEIEPNAVTKPTVPEGDYVDAPLASCCRVVSRLADRLVANQPYFWEAIYPQTTIPGTTRRVPTANPGGKYLVKLFVMGKWRKVSVDDRLPLDTTTGTVAILSSSQATEIWPTLIAKALYKVMLWSNATSSTMGATQSVGFMLNALTGWKSRPYCDLSDSKAADELGKIVPVLDDTPLDVQPSLSMNNALLVCSLSGIRSRNFNSTSGEAYVLSNLHTAPSLSLQIFASLKPSTLDETISLTSATIEFHKLTTILLHTIPNFTQQVVEEWSVVSSPPPTEGQESAEETTRLQPYPHGLPKVVTVQVPETLAMTTIYVSLTCVPLADAPLSLNDRGVFLVERTQLSDPPPPSTTVNANMGLLRPNTTWPFDVVGAGTHVFRLYQHELQYGYSLEIDSDVPMSVLSIVEGFRDVCRMQVEIVEGAYEAMAANGSWHVAARVTATLTPPPQETRNRLYVGVHLFDPDAAAYFHLHMINNHSTQSTRLSLLSGYFELDPKVPIESYTFVLECLPGVAVPQGKFHVTIASDWSIQAPLGILPVLPSVFEGKYMPNKLLTFFRDVFVVDLKDDDPKNAKGGGSATATASMAIHHACLKLSTSYLNAAVKLEVIDLATGNVLTQACSYNSTQLMQLPPCSVAENGTSGYIVQGSFDEAHWVVPDAIRSVQPFNGLLTKMDKVDTARLASSESAPSITAPPPTEATEASVMWRLEVFSPGLPKLTPDCTTPNKYAAIKHGWEVAERGREVRGTISRLLFLGRKQEAIDRMAAADFTPEQQKEMLGRYDFLFGQECHPLVTEGDGEPEDVVAPEYFESESQKLAQELELIKQRMDDAARARAAESAAQKLEMEQIKQEMAAMRQAMLAERDALWQKREELRKQQANPTPPSLFP